MTVVTVFDVGDVATLNYVLEVEDALTGALVLTDATVAVTVTAPDGTVTTPAVSRVSLGTYKSAAVPVRQAGTWTYRWVASGAATDVENGSFEGVAPGPTSVPFVSAEELQTALNRVFTAGEAAQARVILGDASDHLRELIGQQISAGTTTYTDSVEVMDRKVLLPQQPVRSVSAFSLNGTAWPNYQLINGAVYFDRYGDLSMSNHFEIVGGRYGFVTFTCTYAHGFVTIPSEIKKWTRVLASQALAQLDAFGSLGSAGLLSQRVDDFAENFAAGEAAQAFSLPPAAEQRLRARFGRSVGVVRAR